MNVEELTARQLTAILEELPHGVGVLSQPGTWRYVNTLFMLHLGISPLEDKLLNALEHLPELRQGLRAVLEGERDTFDLGKLSCPPRYLNVRVRSANDGLTLITTSDVSAAVASEQAAVQSMLEWQEAERRQLSQEIHDGVGPLLSAIRLSLEGLLAQTPSPNPSFEKNYHNAIDSLSTAMREIRHLSHALMPSALIDFGLVSALEGLCRKGAESGIMQVQFYHAGMAKRLDAPAELGLYRIAQELLNNAYKHARAKLINVQLIQHADSIILMVEDDGVGFEREALAQLMEQGIGLRNIRMRTRALGGVFTIESFPGHGVLATIEIPNNAFSHD